MHLSVRSLARMAKLNLAGMFPPIPTPFATNGEIDADHLSANFEKWQSVGFSGYVVMGSNGEFAYLEAAEKLRLVQLARKLIHKNQLLIAGTGCESTRATIDLTKRAAELGADAALVYTPSFYKNAMGPPALKAHYTAVADASPIPVILYNVPPNTAIDMDAETILALAPHPNIIGLKDSGGDVPKLAKVVEATKAAGQEFQVLAGSAGFFLAALRVGCVGGVCAAANVLGPQMMRLMKAHEMGDAAADAMQERLVKPNAAITRELGVPGLKQALDWSGYFGGPVRPPLLPLAEAAQKHLRETFEKAGFL